MFYKSVIRPLLFKMDAEQAHQLTLRFAQIAEDNDLLLQAIQLIYDYQSPLLSQQLLGLNFRNPVGLAAGFDKNGEVPRVLQAMGMGFVEIGSITALANAGNPKPRAFRLPADQSLINRMGLNNHGAKTIINHLSKKELGIPLGINIAKTNDPAILGKEALQDYRFSYEKALTIADYVTINVSCPNTGEGKTFEDPSALDELLDALEVRNHSSSTPTLVKLSVDLNRKQLEQLVKVCEKHDISGYVASNTSSNRDNLKTSPKSLRAIGRGGLSGRAIHSKSTQIIGWLYKLIQGKKPIIGVGGIDGFEHALAKLKAGADLLQVYTGLIYEGPGLVKQINKKLTHFMAERDLTSIRELHQLS